MTKKKRQTVCFRSIIAESEARVDLAPTTGVLDVYCNRYYKITYRREEVVDDVLARFDIEMIHDMFQVDHQNGSVDASLENRSVAVLKLLS